MLSLPPPPLTTRLTGRWTATSVAIAGYGLSSTPAGAVMSWVRRRDAERDVVARVVGGEVRRAVGEGGVTAAFAAVGNGEDRDSGGKCQHGGRGDGAVRILGFMPAKTPPGRALFPRQHLPLAPAQVLRCVPTSVPAVIAARTGATSAW